MMMEGMSVSASCAAARTLVLVATPVDPRSAVVRAVPLDAGGRRGSCQHADASRLRQMRAEDISIPSEAGAKDVGQVIADLVGCRHLHGR